MRKGDTNPISSIVLETRELQKAEMEKLLSNNNPEPYNQNGIDYLVGSRNVHVSQYFLEFIFLDANKYLDPYHIAQKKLSIWM